MGEETTMEAGSLEAICYLFWQLVDEVLHAGVFDVLIGNARWRMRFCQWTHRLD